MTPPSAEPSAPAEPDRPSPGITAEPPSRRVETPDPPVPAPHAWLAAQALAFGRTLHAGLLGALFRPGAIRRIDAGVPTLLMLIATSLLLLWADGLLRHGLAGQFYPWGLPTWAFPHSLMIAYTAHYAGGVLRPDPAEIADARWFGVDALPELPSGVSIARRLIDTTAARLRAEPGTTPVG